MTKISDILDQWFKDNKKWLADIGVKYEWTAHILLDHPYLLIYNKLNNCAIGDISMELGKIEVSHFTNDTFANCNIADSNLLGWLKSEILQLSNEVLPNGSPHNDDWEL